MQLLIKELREEKQWTQKELADKIGNVQRNISNWENGTSEPDCENILKLADAFNVTLDELFGRNCNVITATAYFDTNILSLLRKLSDEQLDAIKKLILSFKP